MSTTPDTPTPETDAAARRGAYIKAPSLYYETHGKQLVHIDDARKLERERDAARAELAAMTALVNRLAEALEASDECLALIEDVGHGAHMNNVSVARGYVQEALAAPAYFARRLFPITSLTPAN